MVAQSLDLRREKEGERERERGRTIDGGLGCRVERDARHGAPGGAAADVDDRAAVLGAHVGRQELDEAQRAEEIGLEHRACLVDAGRM